MKQISIANNSAKTKGATILSLASLAGATSAQAAIITNTDLGLSGFTVNGSNTSESWNIDNAGSAEADIRTYSNFYIGIYSFQNSLGIRDNGAYLLNLGYSAQVNTGNFRAVNFATVFQNGNLVNTSGFTSGDTGYIGFRFTPSATTLYGWAEVVLTEGANPGSFQVLQWAYDDTGANISTPTAVPEPETAALGLAALALGAAGLRRWRNRKAA